MLRGLDARQLRMLKAEVLLGLFSACLVSLCLDSCSIKGASKSSHLAAAQHVFRLRPGGGRGVCRSVLQFPTCTRSSTGLSLGPILLGSLSTFIKATLALPRPQPPIKMQLLLRRLT